MRAGIWNIRLHFDWNARLLGLFIVVLTVKSIKENLNIEETLMNPLFNFMIFVYSVEI